MTEAVNPSNSNRISRFERLLMVSWWVAFLPMFCLEIRLLYEQTWLTYTSGQQMIGFSLIHLHPTLFICGALSTIASLVWCIITISLFVRFRRLSPKLLKIQFVLASVTLLLMAIPFDRLVLMFR